jgi:FAD/FMN-containing dehydrogenase
MQALETLKSILGPGGWLEEDGDTESYRNDWHRKVAGRAMLVALPHDVQQVADVVNVCCEAGIAITPQGGNTSVSASGVPAETGDNIVVSLKRMNSIRDVSSAGYSLSADAGATLQAVQEAAADQERFFALDIGARGSCTIGGCVSTNAGGLNTLRYGNCREHVLGIEAVLADGTIWNGMRRLRKDNSGYDLKQLFIGAEGTLGIVTGVTLKLHSKPVDQVSAFVALASLEKLTPLLELARDKAGELIDAFELCPEHLVSGVCRVRDDVRRPLETQAEFYVLMRVSGDASIEDRAVEFLSEAMDAGLITDGVLAQSGPQEDMLWKIRDHAIPNLLFEGDMIKQDAALPLEHVVEYISRVKQDLAARWPSAWLYSLGHVGDGNQHICVMGHDLKDRADIASHLNQLLWSLGGTISAEHGIGQLHRAELVEQKSADELRLMRQVKSLFDPTNMFNPNVMLLPPS